MLAFWHRGGREQARPVIEAGPTCHGWSNPGSGWQEGGALILPGHEKGSSKGGCVYPNSGQGQQGGPQGDPLPFQRKRPSSCNWLGIVEMHGEEFMHHAF